MNRAQGNKRVAALLVDMVVTMGALAWAAVPFYSWFCSTTGFGGATVVGTGADKVLDRVITVRFDANTENGMPWEFKPSQKKMDVKVGETGMAFYEAYNPTDRTVSGTAAFNVAPDVAGYYFTKIECFCFTQQTLKPHERVEMPVVFYVDPDIVNDEEGKYLTEITLSYTFYQTENPDEPQSPLASPDDSDKPLPSN